METAKAAMSQFGMKDTRDHLRKPNKVSIEWKLIARRRRKLHQIMYNVWCTSLTQWVCVLFNNKAPL